MEIERCGEKQKFKGQRGSKLMLMTCCWTRTKVLMEGDFSLSKYHNKEGVEKLGMNIIQRKSVFDDRSGK